MAKVQLIKRRIRSVGNTKQITKAMELVSASKMRRAQDAAFRARDYAFHAQEILAYLHALQSDASFPLFQQREVKSRLVILITSDRGLAGAYNSNLLKTFLDSVQHEPAITKVIVIGQKGAQFVTRLTQVEVIGVYTNWTTAPILRDITPIVRTAIAQFASHAVDRIDILYTQFTSTIKQQAVLQPLVPVDPHAWTQAQTHAQAQQDIVFEPSPQQVLEIIVPRLIEVLVFQAYLNAIASEQSMRMMAMKNASDNAEELIDDLTLTYNSVRQAGITQELAEITAGAQAII